MTAQEFLLLMASQRGTETSLAMARARLAVEDVVSDILSGEKVHIAAANRGMMPHEFFGLVNVMLKADQTELSEYWRAVAEGRIGRWVDGRWEPAQAQAPVDPEPARAQVPVDPEPRPKRAISREGL